MHGSLSTHGTREGVALPHMYEQCRRAFCKIDFIISLHRECNVLGMSGRLKEILSNDSHEAAFKMVYN